MHVYADGSTPLPPLVLAQDVVTNEGVYRRQLGPVSGGGLAAALQLPDPLIVGRRRGSMSRAL